MCITLVAIIESEHSGISSFVDATDLLHALNANPTFTTVTPSSRFVTFLQRIEAAVPAPTDGEDDTCQSWGHSLFTSGGLTCTSVLDTWESVGSPSFALRLLAAALTTCRISRWLCVEAKLNVSPGSYLSDSFLNEICTLLWAAWKSAGGVSHIILSIYLCTN